MYALAWNFASSYTRHSICPEVRASTIGDAPFKNGSASLCLFQARVQAALGPRLDGLEQHPLRAVGDVGAHQDADLAKLLPLPIEGKEGAGFEVAGRDVETRRQIAPLLQVPEPGPPGVTVVDDEEVAALAARLHFGLRVVCQGPPRSVGPE